MAVPPAGTDLEYDATDQPVPTSTLGPRRHAYFNSLASLDGTLEGYPDLDVRLLAAARRQERSEEGPEALTKVMRQLL